MSEAARRCDDYVSTRAGAQHMAVNAAKLVAMRRDEALRRLVDGCDLVTADGQAVVWASRLLGDPLPDAGRRHRPDAGASGARGAPRLSRVLPGRPGGRARPCDRAPARASPTARRSPATATATSPRPRSRRSRPRSVPRARICCSSRCPRPRKEYFLGRWSAELDVPFSMGVGGAVDVVAGVTKRAPRLLQRLGLEWAFRLAQEPRRLFRRYLVTNSAFVALTLRDVTEVRAPRAIRARSRGRRRRPPAVRP